MLLGRVGNLNKRGTTEQQVKDLQDYVTTLKSRLDYVLENLDEGNFTTETADKINREYAGGNTYVNVTGGGGGEEQQPVQPVPEGLTIGMVYPVGAIYMSVSETSPSLLFPGTTWERLKDRFLLGAGDDHPAGTEGGEEEHTLTAEEGPAHTHTRGTMEITGYFEGRGHTSANKSYGGSLVPQVGGAFEHFIQGGSKTNSGAAESGSSPTNDRVTFTASKNWTGETSEEGGGVAHNNMPPYLTVYMWKRIS